MWADGTQGRPQRRWAQQFPPHWWLPTLIQGLLTSRVPKIECHTLGHWIGRIVFSWGTKGSPLILLTNSTQSSIITWKTIIKSIVLFQEGKSHQASVRLCNSINFESCIFLISLIWNSVCKFRIFFTKHRFNNYYLVGPGVWSKCLITRSGRFSLVNLGARLFSSLELK